LFSFYCNVFFFIFFFCFFFFFFFFFLFFFNFFFFFFFFLIKKIFFFYLFKNIKKKKKKKKPKRFYFPHHRIRLIRIYMSFNDLSNIRFNNILLASPFNRRVYCNRHEQLPIPEHLSSLLIHWEFVLFMCICKFLCFVGLF
jgi:hypothetical protein